MNQRELFEKWFESEMLGNDDWFRRDDEFTDEYYRLDTRSAWHAWQAAIAAQWQQIDSAPKDGTSILAYTAEGQCEVSWHGCWMQSPCYSTYDGCGSAVLLCEPTHWMPLPPEPTK